MADTRLLVAAAHHGIIIRDGKLYTRNEIDDKDEPIKYVKDIKRFISSALAKWGLCQVMGVDGKFYPVIGKKGLPKYKPIKFEDRIVYQVIEETKNDDRVSGAPFKHNKSFSATYLTKGVEGQPCGVGQNPEKDKCVKAEDGPKQESGQKEQGPKLDPEGHSTEKSQQLKQAITQLIQQTVSRKEAVKEAVKQVGEKAWNKLPPEQQKRLATFYRAVMWVKHKLMIGFKKSRELAVEAAKERGLSEDKVQRLQKMLSVTDGVLAWTVNAPAAYAVTGSMTVSKVSSWIPVASLCYIAQSSVRNPRATYRAARNLIKKQRNQEEHKSFPFAPFIRNKSFNAYLVKSSEYENKPCPKNVTAEKTGCIPQSKPSSFTTEKQFIKKEPQKTEQRPRKTPPPLSDQENKLFAALH